MAQQALVTPRGLTLSITRVPLKYGHVYQMRGGVFGPHDVTMFPEESHVERVWAHWEGYCTVNGLLVIPPLPKWPRG